MAFSHPVPPPPSLLHPTTTSWAASAGEDGGKGDRAARASAWWAALSPPSLPNHHHLLPTMPCHPHLHWQQRMGVGRPTPSIHPHPRPSQLSPDARWRSQPVLGTILHGLAGPDRPVPAQTHSPNYASPCPLPPPSAGASWRSPPPKPTPRAGNVDSGANESIEAPDGARCGAAAAAPVVVCDCAVLWVHNPNLGLLHPPPQAPELGEAPNRHRRPGSLTEM